MTAECRLELFDFSHFPLRYVNRRPPNQKHLPANATQLIIEGIFKTGNRLS